MSLKIQSGFLKGRRLPGPVAAGTRPTTDMLRTSIFSALENRFTLEGMRILDLCCGTGAFGIECISRGASHVSFVDNSKQICSALHKTLSQFHIGNQCDVINEDAIHYLNNDNNVYDLIFTDPPYDAKLCNSIASIIISHILLREKGITIFEHADSEAILPIPTFHKIWYKQQGSTIVEMYAKQGVTS